MKNILVLAASFLLLACTAPVTPAQTVYSIESQYATALKIELAYTRLPKCGTATVVCRDTELLKKVRKADDVAWDAIKNAQDAVRTPGFGDSQITTILASTKAVVKAFVDITSTLKVK